MQQKRSSVANTLRLLELERDIQQGLMERKISSGHEKVLLGVQDRQERKKWYQQLLSNSWPVRELDEAIRGGQSHINAPKNPIKTKKTDKKGGSTHVKAEEERLGQFLGTKVSVLQIDRKGRGKISIDFFSTEDYERITDLIVGKS